jgi:glycine/D-amino acid oxidase-like deaminating enzyme
MAILYQDTAERAPETPSLKHEARCDVVVIGGGFTGLSTALHLASGGSKVVLLEAQSPGFGASGRNGGQVNPGLKLDPDTVERDHGSDLGARMNALAGRAPDLVFDLVSRLAIACEARRNGTLRAAITEEAAAPVRVTAEQLKKRGAPAEMLGAEEVARLTGTSRYRAAMFDRRGGDLNPLSYARGLARAAIEAGAAIHGGSRALSVAREGSGWEVRTSRAKVLAARVVIATNGYSDDLWPRLKRSIVPVFGAIAATAPLPDSLAKLVMPQRAVLYESGLITVYYRVDAQNRLLIGGRGPMHEIHDCREIAPLLRYAARLWPALEGIAFTHAWGGRLAMTRDHYPHVHEPAPGLLICLGYNGRGVALATALGQELARYIASPAAGIDMPISGIKAIPLHRFWRVGVRFVIARARFGEALRRG